MEATVPEAALGTINRMARGVDAIPRRIITVGAAYTVVPEDNRALILAATDNTVVTLPLASANKGLSVTIQNVAASGAAKVSISPNALDAIVGTVMAVPSGGVVNKDWINTKATAVKGDYTTLVSDGGTSWLVGGGVGVWASEA